MNKSFCGYWSHAHTLEGPSSALEIGADGFRYWSYCGYLEGKAESYDELLVLKNADNESFPKHWTLITNNSDSFGLLPIQRLGRSFFSNEPLWMFMFGLVSRDRPENWPTPFASVLQPGFNCSEIDPKLYSPVSEDSLFDYTPVFFARLHGRPSVDWCGWLEKCLMSNSDVLEDCILHLTGIACREDTWSCTPSSLDEVIGPYKPTILQDGLQDIPPEVIENLLDQPKLLVDLQKLVLVEGGEKWRKKVEHGS